MDGNESGSSDPSAGRFISQDPLPGVLSDPQSLNPYVYVQDSPTVHVDPTGMVEEGGEHSCSEDGTCGFRMPESIYGDPTVLRGSPSGGESPYSGLTVTSNELVANPLEPSLVGPATIEPTSLDTNAAASSASVSELEGARPSWPANAEGMQKLLGEPGTSVPDTAATPGRGQMRWEIRSDPRMRIVGEQHPYDLDASPNKQVWHWRVDPGHYTGYPGEAMPDWLVKILTDEGYL